jgi:hypothetical protein
MRRGALNAATTAIACGRQCRAEVKGRQNLNEKERMDYFIRDYFKGWFLAISPLSNLGFRGSPSVGIPSRPYQT